jgi:hypothetical protein
MKVLDVSASKDEEGQAVIVSKKNEKTKEGAANQKWKVIYLDKAEAIRSKGFNKDFGFHINRPFYIRSRMPMKRV